MERRKYQRLVVWQKSMDLVSDIYQTTEAIPDIERFGLTAQMRRAAVSIPSNIAEGAGRNSDKDFVRFLNIAGGSLQELETQLLLAAKLNYLDDIQQHLEQIEHIFAMLSKLKSTLAR